MKKNFVGAIVFTILAGLFHACNEPLIEETDTVNNLLKSAQSNKISYIVVLDDAELNDEFANVKGYEMRQQATKIAAEKVLNRAAVLDGELGYVYSDALKGFSVKIAPGQLKKLENDPSVLRIEEDQVITLVEPNAKPGAGEIGASASQVTPWGITRVNGGTTYTGSAAAWVIDTGIDLDHPDLNVDASRGNVYVNASSPDDDHGHGSHVAGTIAAVDNSEGVIGVAAGATVIPVKVLDHRGSGTTSGVIAGVDHVAAYGKPGDVANMSLGGGFLKSLNDAVINASAKGIKFSLAAGNESTDAGTRSPASADGDNIYTVSAMAEGDYWASYSNYGNPPVDFCAPGSGVYSTYKDGGYRTSNGTSMAAPHVAGLLLLGNTKTDGSVKNDPDRNSDPILVHNGTLTQPQNNPPSADFNFVINELSVQFSDTSTDPDGNSTITDWSWSFGDGNTSAAKNPSHTYASVGTYTVTLSVTDNNGASDSKAQNVTVSENSFSGITFTANGYKVKGRHTVDLAWSNASSTVTIYRDNTVIATNVSGSTYTDRIGNVGGGTYVYKVSDGTNYSKDVTVDF